MNIAIIGSGIAGLTCAWRLAGHHQVTLFEAGATPGGHTATVDVATPQGTWAIDTGFIVYNDRTYPRFMGLLSELGIDGQKTQMSFSVHNPTSGLEYNGHSLTSLFAQRRNLLKPAFWGLLSEIVRFNRLAKLALTEALRPYVPHVTLGAWNAAWPRAQVLQWISGLPVLELWQAAVGEIALVSYAADALHGPLTCHARYDLRGRRLQWREWPGWV